MHNVAIMLVSINSAVFKRFLTKANTYKQLIQIDFHIYAR